MAQPKATEPFPWLWISLAAHSPLCMSLAFIECVRIGLLLRLSLRTASGTDNGSKASFKCIRMRRPWPASICKARWSPPTTRRSFPAWSIAADSTWLFCREGFHMSAQSMTGRGSCPSSSSVRPNQEFCSVHNITRRPRLTRSDHAFQYIAFSLKRAPSQAPSAVAPDQL